MNPQDILSRIFEPMEWGWEHRFKVGTKVRIKRPILMGLPVGAEGVVVGIDPDNEKGRVLNVEFDMTPYGLKLSDMMGGDVPEWAREYADEPLLKSSTDLTPMDVEVIE